MYEQPKQKGMSDRRLYEYEVTMNMNRLRERGFFGHGVSEELMNPSECIYWLL